VGNDLSADPAFVTATATDGGFLRLSQAGVGATQPGNVAISGIGNFATVTASDMVALNNLYWSNPKCGAYNLGALDFEPTVQSAGTGPLSRSYDDFGANAASGTKIGAPIHPYNLSMPTEFSCWFQSAVGGFPGRTVTANLWKVPLGGGSVSPGSTVISSLIFTEAAATTGPTKVSNTSFSGGGFVTFDGTTGYQYLVELDFLGDLFPTVKANGCVVRWCATTVSP